MKYVVLFIFAALATATPASAQYNSQKQEYSQVLPDIPLMQGMQEDAPEKDPADQEKLKNPNYTSGVVSGNHRQVNSYYQQEFWKQGWKNETPGTPNVFVKDGERIIMTTDFRNGQTTVTFTRQPLGGAAQPKKKGAQDDQQDSSSNKGK